LSNLATTGFRRARTDHSAVAEQIKGWTRARFGLGEDAAVMVGELACALPGCPPIETVIAFWTEGDKRHHFKVFKPLDAVTPDDIPPAWLREALAVPEGLECDCC